MNKEYVYTTVLKNKSLETIFREVDNFINSHREDLKSITPTQWNALLSFCLRKNHIEQMKEYLKRKIERRGNPWYETSAQKVAQSLISKFEVIEEKGLGDTQDKTLRTLNVANLRCFKEEWTSPELSTDILYKLKLQQIQTFISVLVKQILIEKEK